MTLAYAVTSDRAYDLNQVHELTQTPGGRLRVEAASTLNTGLATSQATVTTSSAQVLAARATRDSVTIENLGTTAVYFGGPGVTASTGFLLPGVVGASVTIPTTAAIYAVVGSGSQAVAFLESF